MALCNIKLSDDQFQIYLEKVVVDDLINTPDIIEAYKDFGFTPFLGLSQVEKSIALLNEHHSIKEVLLVEANYPKSGQKDRTNFYVNASGMAFFDPPEISGRIDFKKAMKITTVDKNDVLAKYIEGIPGVTGTNVYGQTVGCDDDETAALVAGLGVEKISELYLSTRKGVPKMKGNTLVVDDVLVIAGNIDLKVGNISSNNSVDIRGDVLEVFSKKDIRILGVVGASLIEAKGDITIKSGVNGKGKGVLASQGKVKVSYLNRVKVQVEEGIEVMKDSYHSQLNSLSSVCVKGSVVGGSVMSSSFLEVGFLGSDACVKALVQVGCHYKCELLSEKYTDLLNRANVMLDKYKTDLNNKTILNKRAGEVEQDLHGLKLLCK